MSLLSVNDDKNSVSNSLLTTYGNKSVELNVIKDTTNMYQSSLLEKEKILMEEKQKLVELSNQVWTLKDSCCNQMWQFSREHDFSIIFKYYPFITETNRCKMWRNNNSNNDIEGSSSKIIDLINEIDAIKADIFNLSRGNFKQDIESALTKLKKLQSISENAIELLRLINPQEYSDDVNGVISIPIYDEIIPNHIGKITRRINNSNCKNFQNKKTRDNKKDRSLRDKPCLKNDKSNVAANKKNISTTHKNYPQLSLEKTIVFNPKTRVTNVSTEPNNVKRYKSFTPRKRSDISVRFEQQRDNYNK